MRVTQRVPLVEARRTLRTWWRSRGGHERVPPAEARSALRT